jgi:hypothetical protein
VAPTATRLAPVTHSAPVAVPEPVIDEPELDTSPFDVVDTAVGASPTGSGTGDETEERALPDELDFSWSNRFARLTIFNAGTAGGFNAALP